MKKLRIALCDDHQIIREGLRSLLDRQPDMTVTGEGTNGLEAVRLVREQKLDVIVIDVAMPDMNGISATRRIREENKDIRILALSMHSDMRFVTGMIDAGACGYLLKDCAFAELATAIRAVAGGGIYISPRIASQVLQEMTQRNSQIAAKPKPSLSQREEEILQLIAEGKSTKEIADVLHLSAKTVETHRRHLMEKVGIHNVAALTKYAIREGLTTTEV